MKGVFCSDIPTKFIKKFNFFPFSEGLIFDLLTVKKYISFCKSPEMLKICTCLRKIHFLVDGQKENQYDPENVEANKST
jgi:hypothetical protein